MYACVINITYNACEMRGISLMQKTNTHKKRNNEIKSNFQLFPITQNHSNSTGIHFLKYGRKKRWEVQQELKWRFGSLFLKNQNTIRETWKIIEKFFFS